MARSGPGFDPRIIVAAILAQQQAARQPKGIPLIDDVEAERRQLEADAARRRRRRLRRLLLVLVPLGIALAGLSTQLPATPAT